MSGLVTIASSPATGTQLYFDHPRLSPAGFQVPFEDDIQITEDVQYLYNDIAVTRNFDQATYRARDAASRSKFYPRIYTRTIFSSLADPQAVPDCANWLLSAYSQPAERVQRVVVDAAADPEAWEFVLGTDIGDTLTFVRNPVGAPEVAGTFIVLSIEIEWLPDQAKYTYVLGPALNPILTLDSTLFDLNGASELGW
jgi:hypothetical protein